MVHARVSVAAATLGLAALALPLPVSSAEGEIQTEAADPAVTFYNMAAAALYENVRTPNRAASVVRSRLRK